MLERLYEFEDQVFDCLIINHISFYKVSYEVSEGTGLIVNDRKDGKEEFLAEIEVSKLQHIVAQQKDDVTVIV